MTLGYPGGLRLLSCSVNVYRHFELFWPYLEQIISPRRINWIQPCKNEDVGFPQNFGRHSSKSTASHIETPKSCNKNLDHNTSGSAV